MKIKIKIKAKNMGNIAVWPRYNCLKKNSQSFSLIYQIRFVTFSISYVYYCPTKMVCILFKFKKNNERNDRGRTKVHAQPLSVCFEMFLMAHDKKKKKNKKKRTEKTFFP